MPDVQLNRKTVFTCLIVSILIAAGIIGVVWYSSQGILRTPPRTFPLMRTNITKESDGWKLSILEIHKSHKDDQITAWNTKWFYSTGNMSVSYTWYGPLLNLHYLEKNKFNLVNITWYDIKSDYILDVGDYIYFAINGSVFTPPKSGDSILFTPVTSYCKADDSLMCGEISRAVLP